MIFLYRKFAAFDFGGFPVNFIKQFVVKIPIVLSFTFHQEYCTLRPGNVDILCRSSFADGPVRKFAIFESRTLDAREIFVFCIIVVILQLFTM